MIILKDFKYMGGSCELTETTFLNVKIDDNRLLAFGPSNQKTWAFSQSKHR